MHRPVVKACAFVLAALASGACGGEDDRPATLEYITSAILAPSCAAAQCHSEFVQAEGLDFSSVAAARRTITDYGLISQDETGATGDPDASLLFLVLVSPGGDGFVPRMPWDRPMPNADIALIQRWIEDGAAGL